MIMKLLSLLFLAAASAFSQPFAFGVRGGVPFTDFLNATSTGSLSGFGNYVETTNRYIIGPTAELRLPFGLGVEFDVLYRHLNYASSNPACNALLTCVISSSTTGSAWEFPLLGKYRFHGKFLRPYVDAGVAWNTLSGLKQTVFEFVSPGEATTTSTSTPAELHNSTVTGFVTGVGIDIHVLLLHLSPEIRYTRWGAQNFLSPNGGLSSNQNQAEFLLGVTF
jgi:opacity protein-like surface antigen